MYVQSWQQIASMAEAMSGGGIVVASLPPERSALRAASYGDQYRAASVRVWSHWSSDQLPWYTPWLLLLSAIALLLVVVSATWWARRRAQRRRGVPYYWENGRVSARHAEDRHHKDFFDESFPLPVEIRAALQVATVWGSENRSPFWLKVLAQQPPPITGCARLLGDRFRSDVHPVRQTRPLGA